MLSRTYQLSSELDTENSLVDSGNTWYWRFDRRRLDAESLRDSILSLGGTLDLSRPGLIRFLSRRNGDTRPIISSTMFAIRLTIAVFI